MRPMNLLRNSSAPTRSKALPIARLAMAPLAMGLMLAGCGEANDESAHVAPPRPAKIYTIAASERVTTHSYVALVEAVQTVDMSFQVGGRLAQLPVREAAILKEGALIAALDPGDYELALRQARTNADLSERDLERKRELAERRVISTQELDNAQSKHDLNQIAVDDAQRKLDYATLHAPFDALVTRRLVDNFTQVAPGTTVVRLQDVSELRLSISVPARVLATVKPENIVSMHASFPFLQERNFDVTYYENSTQADEVTQTYRVVFTMERPEDVQILPGMSGTLSVTFRDKQDTDVIRVPFSAIAPQADGTFQAWVVDRETNLVSAQTVTIGAADQGFVPVLSGLEKGQTVVTAGVHQLFEGMEIAPLEEATDVQQAAPAAPSAQ